MENSSKYLSKEKRRKKYFVTWFKQSKESFSKEFVIVADFSYKGKVKMIKIDKNVKIISNYYQEHILTPIFKYKIPDLYP